MGQHREQFQYTLRVKDTHHQYIETAYTEAEARQAAAAFHLKKMGLEPSDPGWEEALRDCVAQLLLVYLR